MKPFIVGEGKTEERVIETILGEEQYRFQVVRAGGKNQLVSVMEARLVTNPSILFLRDCDSGETIEKVCQGIAKELKRSAKKRGLPWDELDFQPVEGWNNIFSCTISSLSMSPAPQIHLHVASPVDSLKDILGEHYPFRSTTTDDYILAAALTEGVLEKFSIDKKVSILPEALKRKVVEKIPSLLRENGIRDIVAKDMNAIYMTVARFPSQESNEAFAEKVVRNAFESSREEYQHIFASHIAAIGFLSQKEQPV